MKFKTELQMKNSMLKIVALAGLLFASGFAAAVPFIEGQIDFGGGAVVSLDANGAITQINFIDPPISGAPTVLFGTSDFSGLAGSAVTFVDPFIVAIPMNNLWQVGGFSFDLLSINVNKSVDFDVPLDGTWDYSVLRGDGILSKVGYEDTSGKWSFSTQGFDLGQGGTFSFSSTSIPEPASLAIFGLGLIGFGLARRKQQS